MAIVTVKYQDHKIGYLAWDHAQNTGVFEFLEEFVAQNIDLAPVTMPLEALQRGQRIFTFPDLNKQTFEGLPGLLADALPDAFGNAVLRSWLRSQNREISSLTPIEKLSYVGSRAMGALEFEPSTISTEAPEEIEVERLLKLTNKVLEDKSQLNLHLNTEEENTMATLIRVGASAGGQRPKALIGFNPITKEVRSGQLQLPEGFEYYLLKFDGVSEGALGDPAGYGRSEMAYHLMAKDCGIHMMPCRLLEENDRAHFMTKRFDRTDEGTKIHMQTLCALAHFDFMKPGIYDYEDCFEEMRDLNLPYPDMEQLYRRMLFNVVARNQDDHTKNISFVLRSGEWRLAPAYDVAWSFNPQGEWTNVHQMSIGGKRADFRKNDLIEVGKRQSIKKPAAILDQINEVVSRWEWYGQETDVPDSLSGRIKVSHRIDL